MSLTKINCIRNVGKFTSCIPGADIVFSRYTFIYADNGSGKTTFCNILRSLKTGLPEYVSGRKTLGSDEEIDISFNIAGRNISFTNGTWSETLPIIEVFDETFVADNIYTSSGVGHEHKRNLYQVIVGEEGVRLAQEYERQDIQSRSLSDRLRQSEQAITRSLLPHVLFTDLATLTHDPDIDSKIVAARRNLSAVNELETIRTRELLTELNLPKMAAGLNELLTASIEGVTAGVSERIAEQIRSHNFGDNGERWLAVGTQHTTETCPFCAQDLEQSPIISDLTSYFSEAYKQLKTRIDQFEESIASTLSERAITQILTQIRTNTSNHEFWSQYCTLPVLTIDSTYLESTLSSLRQTALDLIERKRSAVLEPVSTSLEYDAAIANYSTLVQSVDAYNENTRSAHAIIYTKKQEAGTANARSAERGLNLLLTTRELHSGNLQAHHAEYLEIQSAYQQITTSKTIARAAVDTYTADIISRYETRLNQLLLAFNANFSVSGVSHDYRGAGSPRSSFQIVINDTAVAPGDADTPLDRPSFKNTLSSGDRSVLALAFFWAKLELKGNLAETIVVLDDPFTSQDWFRRTATAQKATRSQVAESAAQIILLSHDEDFLREAVNSLQREKLPILSVYAIHPNSLRTVTLIPHDLFKADRSPYKADIQSMLLYMNETQGVAIDVARKIRPTLETYLKTTYPNEVNSTEELGTIVRGIKATQGTHPVFELAEELEELNIYDRRYHHGDEQAAAQVVNPAELKGYIRRTLKVVGSL